MFTWKPGQQDAYFGPVWGDRGVAADASDVARFEDDLYGGRLLSPGSLAQMLAPTPYPTSFGHPYGLGTEIFIGQAPETAGHLLVGHTGVMPGYVGYALRDQDAGVTVTVLINSELRKDQAVGKIWHAVYRAWAAAQSRQSNEVTTTWFGVEASGDAAT